MLTEFAAAPLAEFRARRREAWPHVMIDVDNGFISGAEPGPVILRPVFQPRSCYS